MTRERGSIFPDAPTGPATVAGKKNGMPSADAGELLARAQPIAIWGIFILLMFGAIYFARDLFQPIFLAIILALTLSPIVRALCRFGIPATLAAVMVVLTLGLGITALGSALFIPLTAWTDRFPEVRIQIRERLADLHAPIKAVQDAQKEVSDIAKTTASGEKIQKVEVQGPSMMFSAAGGLLKFGAMLLVTATLLVFLLGSGSLFYARLMALVDTASDRAQIRVLSVVMERDVSHYLFTVTLINVGLGTVIGLGLWALGVPTPHLWGAMAAMANFVPFVGAIFGAVVVSAVALVSFDSLGPVALVAGWYLLCTVVEGQFITPLVVGRRLELDTVAVFLSLALWFWIWGVMGALLAVPLLVLAKSICDHVPGLRPFGAFLSDETP